MSVPQPSSPSVSSVDVSASSQHDISRASSPEVPEDKKEPQETSLPTNGTSSTLSDDKAAIVNDEPKTSSFSSDRNCPVSAIQKAPLPKKLTPSTLSGTKAAIVSNIPETSSHASNTNCLNPAIQTAAKVPTRPLKDLSNPVTDEPFAMDSQEVSLFMTTTEPVTEDIKDCAVTLKGLYSNKKTVDAAEMSTTTQGPLDGMSGSRTQEEVTRHVVEQIESLLESYPAGGDEGTTVMVTPLLNVNIGCSPKDEKALQIGDKVSNWIKSLPLEYQNLQSTVDDRSKTSFHHKRKASMPFMQSTRKRVKCSETPSDPSSSCSTHDGDSDSFRPDDSDSDAGSSAFWDVQRATDDEVGMLKLGTP